MSFFSYLCHSCRTRVARVWNSCCKIRNLEVDYFQIPGKIDKIGNGVIKLEFINRRKSIYKNSCIELFLSILTVSQFNDLTVKNNS